MCLVNIQISEYPKKLRKPKSQTDSTLRLSNWIKNLTRVRGPDR